MVLGIVLGLSSAFIFSTTTLAIKAHADNVNPLSFNVFRMTVGSIFTIALLPFFVGMDLLAQTPSSAVIVLSISSIVGIAAGDTFYFWSLNKLGASRALPLAATYPLYTWLIAVPLLGEQVTASALFGTALVLVGVYLLSPAGENVAVVDARTHRRAVFAALAAAVCWSVATTLLKLGAQECPHVLVVNAVRMPVAALAGCCVAQIYGGAKIWSGIDRKSLPRLTVIALYGTGIGLIVWTLAVDMAGAARAALLNSTSPLIGVPLSAIFLRERITPRVVMGTLLAVWGIWMIL
jgi:drug/metabolite transporter (DMT)-like permease